MDAGFEVDFLSLGDNSANRNISQIFLQPTVFFQITDGGV